ncbi:hypothetical protein [Pseudactinotalea sp.]
MATDHVSDEELAADTDWFIDAMAERGIAGDFSAGAAAAPDPQPRGASG